MKLFLGGHKKALLAYFLYLLILTLLPTTAGALLTAGQGVSLEQFGLAALAAVLLAIILSLLTLFLLWQKWIRPLDSLETFLQILGGGDPVRAEQFFSQAGSCGAFREMGEAVLDSCFRIIGHMQRSSDQLNHFVGVLHKGTVDSQRSFREISGAMQEIAGGADEQAAAAQRVAENVGVLTNLAEEIAEQARSGTLLAAEVRQKEQEGRQLLEQLLQEIREAADSNELAARQMHRLEEQMSQIGEFVRVVTDIAEQTNLLSLNAAIEAARAGEQGRGFAVVAEEVRKLAEQSAQAAQNITRLAEAIQAEAKETAHQVERNVQLVKGNIERGQNAKVSFLAIGQAIGQAVKAMEEINSRAQQQVERVRAVNEDANRMAAVAEETAASIEEVTAATSEQQAIMAEVQESMEQLANMARNFASLAADYTRSGWDEATCKELIARGHKVLEELALKPEVQGMELKEMAPLLDSTFDRHPFIQTFIAALPDGTTVYNRPSAGVTNWAFRPWFREAMEGRYFATEPYITQSTNRLAITVSVPVKKDGEIVGVLAANVVPARD